MMNHKAFVFDYDGFIRELRPILEQALSSGKIDNLISFIQSNRNDLKDPYKGEPLASDFESTMQNKDVHEYGDVALTKYYDPQNEQGLGAEWEKVQELIAAGSARKDSPILGSAIGPKGKEFDPGRMGSYFQSPEQVRRNHQYLTELNKAHSDFGLERSSAMLSKAAKRGKGLYVTF